MGWLHQDDEVSCEGWVVAVLPDGTDAPRDTFEEARKADEEDRTWAWSIKYDGAAGPRAAGVRAICHCGWRSSSRRPTWDAPEEVEEALRRKWFHHVEVHLSQTLPRHIQKLVDELEEAVLGLTAPLREGDDLDAHRPLVAVHAATRLRFMAESWQEEAVRAAKAGYSWEEIARPLGTSKQAAWERFRSVDNMEAGA